MKKNKLIALVACAGFFVLWILFQTFVTGGTFVGIIFCGAMVYTWKAIVDRDKRIERKNSEIGKNNDLSFDNNENEVTSDKAEEKQ